VRKAADLLLLGAIALLAHLAYWYASNGDWFYPDSPTYLIPARYLLRGLGFVSEPGIPETLRTPGYPLFLLPFLAATMRAAPIVLAQHLMGEIMTLAVYLGARRLFDSRAAALAAGILFALDPLTIHYANKVLSETLFTALLLALVLLTLDRRERWLSGAVVAGLLVLVRPVAIAYFLLVAIVRQRRRALAFAAVAALFPLGWAIRNGVATGVYSVSSVSGINMLFHRAAGALAIGDDYEFRDALGDRQQELLEDADEILEKQEHVEDADDLPQAVRSRVYGALGRKVALEHPFGLALLHLRGVLVNLFGSDWEAVMIVSRFPPDVVHMAIDALTAAEAVFAAIGLLVLWRRQRDAALFVGGTIVYFLVIAAGGEAEPRFRVPVMPEIAIAAGAGLVRACGERALPTDSAAPQSAGI
jgi:hypothetical protein